MDITRIKLIRKLQQDMLSFVYAQQKKVIAEEMYLYAIQNQNLLNCNTNTFIHDGLWYTGGDKIKGDENYRPNRTLHPDILEKVLHLFQQEFEAILQQGTLQIHFGQTLIIARRKQDLFELLPYPLHDMVNMVDRETFDYGPALTQQEIDQFKKDNNDGITCLNSMLLLELLLSK